MAYREFSDEAGQVWVAWDTRPQNPNVVAHGYEDGWLSFQYADRKYRLTPIPAEWSTLGDRRLQGLLAEAMARGRTDRAPRPSPT